MPQRLIADAAYDYIALFLLGLGISLSPHEYFGGLFLAMSAATFIAGQRNDPRKKWVILLSAFFLATGVAWAWPWVSERYGIGIPVQAPMATAGLLSKWVWPFIIRFLDRVLTRTETIADRAVDRVVPPTGNSQEDEE